MADFSPSDVDTIGIFLDELCRARGAKGFFVLLVRPDGSSVHISSVQNFDELLEEWLKRDRGQDNTTVHLTPKGGAG